MKLYIFHRVRGRDTHDGVRGLNFNACEYDTMELCFFYCSAVQYTEARQSNDDTVPLGKY